MGRGKEERERERREGGNVKSFAREAIYRFVKFIAQLRFFFFYATSSFRGNNFRNVTIITRAAYCIYLNIYIYISGSGSNEMDGLISLSIGRGFLSPWRPFLEGGRGETTFSRWTSYRKQGSLLSET